MLAATPYAFHLHPDVIALLGAIVGGYVVAVRVAGPRHAPDRAHPVTRLQGVMFATGVLTLALALGWPIHDIAEEHLFAFHMVQHMLIMFIAAPLLLLGTPGWMLRWILGPGVALRAFRWLSRPPIAFAISNVMTILLHVPPVIQLQVDNYAAHVGFHQAMLLSGVLMWMPVLSPMPEIRRIARPAQMLYLFLQSLLPTIPTSFLTFGEEPLYQHYVTTVRLWGISPVDDQMIAGLLMKIAGGMLLWAAIATIFFVWQADEERGDKRQRQRAVEWDSLVRSFREEATVR